MNTEVHSLSLLQGNLPDPGFEPGSPALQMDSLPAELPGKPMLYLHLIFNYDTRQLSRTTPARSSA